jgi:hypothetical protein
MEDVLVSVDQRTWSLHEELNAIMEETQMELQTSLDKRTRSLRKETTDTKKDFGEESQSDVETT